MLTDEEIDKQLILDTLESVDGEFEIKAENYAKIIKNLESEIAAIKEEEARLAARRRSRENNIQLLKNNLEASMKKTGKTKFKTSLFNFSIAKNGGKAPLKIDVPVDLIPLEYFRRTERELNNELIRNDLDAGKIDFAHYEDRGESLRIK
jgi:hypothetical protein